MVVGDPTFIDRHTVWVDLGDRLSNLESLVADTPQQVERVHKMQQAIETYRAQTAAISQALHAGRNLNAFAALERGRAAAADRPVSR